MLLASSCQPKSCRSASSAMARPCSSGVCAADSVLTSDATAMVIAVLRMYDIVNSFLMVDCPVLCLRPSLFAIRLFAIRYSSGRNRDLICIPLQARLCRRRYIAPVECDQQRREQQKVHDQGAHDGERRE